MNRKAWLIALAALPAFTISGEPMLPQALLVAGISAALSMPWLLFRACCSGPAVLGQVRLGGTAGAGG